MILFLSFKFYFFLPTFFLLQLSFFLLFSSFMIYFLLMIFLSPNTQFYPLLFCHKMKKIKNLPLHPFFKRDNLILNEIIVYTSINVCINNYRSSKRLWAPFLSHFSHEQRASVCDFVIADTKKRVLHTLLSLHQ